MTVEKILEGLLQLAILAFILAQIGREYYAAALLIISIQATIDLARGGMQKATLKYVSEHKGKKDYAAANGVLASSSAMQGAVGILGLVGCLVIAPYTSGIFSLPAYMLREAQLATMLLGLGIAVSFAISPWQNSIAAQERYDLISLATFSGKLFRAFLIVILLLSDAPSLISLVAATLAGTIVDRLICFCLVKKISPQLKFDYRNVSWNYTKQILGFSFFDFFHTLSGFLYMQGSLFLAAHLLSLHAVAALGIIGNITTLIGMAMSEIAQMLVPVASRLQALGEEQKLKNLVSRGTTITVFAGGIVLAGLVPWIKSFLNTWLGHTYIELAGIAIVLMSASFLLNSLTCIHNCLGGIGKVAVDGISNTICALVGLGIGIMLVFFTKLDLMGLAMGLFLARFFRFIFISWYGTRLFRIDLGKFLWKGYLRTYFLVIMISLCGWFTGLSFNSWSLLLSLASVTILIYFFLGFFWIVDAEDRFRFLMIFSPGFEYFKKSFLKRPK
jgi:membrane protein EpsK